jgi:HSP20 family protein
MPAVDVFSREGKLIVKAEMPGMTEKEIDLKATADTLTISGEKQEDKEIK